MYSRCISCRAHLGRNQALEAFQVGRRLAFDTHTGRLWVLCAVCRTWNLSPIEERWEAVEEAERLFETAAIGSSTEHIALGRIAEGTELVRIGRADRQEFAAWRYGRKLRGRYWRGWLRTVAIGAGAPVVSGAVGWGPVYLLTGVWAAGLHRKAHRPVLRTGSGDVIRRRDAAKAQLHPDHDGDGWSVVIPRRRRGSIRLDGTDGLHALRAFLADVNADLGRPDHVRFAADEVDWMGSPEVVMREAAKEFQSGTNRAHGGNWGLSKSQLRSPRPLKGGRPVITLALEMAVNEEMERRVLEGEVALLEREWREAEELAAIADDLLFPRHLRERLRALKHGSAG